MSDSKSAPRADVPLQVFIPDERATGARRDVKRPRPGGERRERTALDRRSNPVEKVTPAAESKPSYRKLQLRDSVGSSDDEVVAYQARFTPSNDDGKRAGKPRAQPRKFVSPSVLDSSDTDSEMEKAIAASLRDMRSDPRRMGGETEGEAPRGRRRGPEEAASESDLLVDSEGSDAERIPATRRMKRRKKSSRIDARERKKWDFDSDEPSESDDDDLKVPGRKTCYSDNNVQSDSEDERLRKRSAGFAWDSDEDNSEAEDKATRHLAQIKNRKDAVLQLLLFDAGFTGFNLLPHQFRAVRFVAGLPDHFPYDEEWTEVEDEMSQADEAVEEMLRRDDAGKKARKAALKEAKMIDTMGGICADEMGLGKTIEALGGVVLRQSRRIYRGKKPKPSLIVCPQDGVMAQWIEALVVGGIHPSRIEIIGNQSLLDGQPRSKASERRLGRFILCTRFRIMHTLKGKFEYDTLITLQQSLDRCALFKNVKPELIRVMQNQYLARKGAEKDKYKVSGLKEKPCDRITRLLREHVDNLVDFTSTFETVIIDEAHFLRNVLSLWGLGACLLGSHSKRIVLLSGTPYNNGPSDMSALMTFIDPYLESAQLSFWENATRDGSPESVIKEVSEWSQTYMLRRTKSVLETELPPRTRTCTSVPIFPSQIGYYEHYEEIFLQILDMVETELEGDSPAIIREKKRMMDIMMACCSCMRMVLIQPICPGGREMTKYFSPSRHRHVGREEQCDKCVFCQVEKDKSLTDENKNELAGKWTKRSENKPQSGLGQFLAPEFDKEESGDFEGNGWQQKQDKDCPGRDKMKNKVDLGPLVPLCGDICRTAGTSCRHFAHEKCLKIRMKELPNLTCPRCLDLRSRLHLGRGKVYCQNIKTPVSDQPGFKSTPKLDKLIKWFKGVPQDDKCIVLSFFKGSLDLVEGILHHEFGVNCVRYDGDIGKETRERELQQFKKNRNYRVLLATVQSGGVGLNIVEANHICFIDRWFNPQTHDQAESRCHRLGQKKDVKITYLDCCYTVDMAMRLVNKLKENNSKVLLADGTDLGLAETDRYQDLQGIIGKSLKEIASMRKSAIETNEAMGFRDEPLICEDEEFKRALMSKNQSPRMKAENRVGAFGDDKPWDHNMKIKDERKNSVKRREQIKSETFKPEANGMEVIDLLDSDNEGETKEDSEQELKRALEEATKQGDWEKVGKIASKLAQIK